MLVPSTICFLLQKSIVRSVAKPAIKTVPERAALSIPKQPSTHKNVSESLKENTKDASEVF
jgi:hypothetical protein